MPVHMALSTPLLGEQLERYTERTEDIVHCSLEAARMPTSSGQSALHLAVESKQDKMIVDLVLEMDKNALLTIGPITGLFPFMLAVVSENNTLDTVYALLCKDPSMI